MAKLSVNDPRLKNSRNRIIADLRSKGWIYLPESPFAIVQDLRRGGLTVRGVKTSESLIYADFEKKKAQEEEKLHLAQVEAGDNDEKRSANARRYRAIEQKLETKAAKQFFTETLFSETAPNEKELKEIDKAFISYHQDMTGFIKSAIGFEMQMPHIKSETDSKYHLSIDDLKTKMDWRINEKGEIYLDAQIGFKLKDLNAEDAQKGMVDVPGKVSYEFVLTPRGFKLNYIDFSNSLLQDLCLGTQNEIVLERGLFYAAREEALKRPATRDKSKQKQKKISGFFGAIWQFVSGLFPRAEKTFPLSNNVMPVASADLSIFGDEPKRPIHPPKSEPHQTKARSKNPTDKEVLAKWEKERSAESRSLRAWFGSFFQSSSTPNKKPVPNDAVIKRTFKR